MVGDKLYIKELYVPPFEKFCEGKTIKNVEIVVIDVKPDYVYFNFEECLFQSYIDDNYKEGTPFEDTKLGVYLRTIFLEELAKAIKVIPKYCSLLKEEDFKNLPYFKKPKTRVKNLIDFDEYTVWYWFSSPSVLYSTYFVGCSSYGNCDLLYASIENGAFSPCFCLN